jgi:signal transduction histidine kinase
MSAARSPVAWVRARPLVGDGLLAVLLAGLAVSALHVSPDAVDIDFRQPDALGVCLVLLAYLPLALRRSHPFPVHLAIGVPAVLVEVLGYRSGVGGVGVLITTYTVAALCARRLSVVALLLSLAGTAVVLANSPIAIPPAAVLAQLLIFGTAWVMGRNLGIRRAYTASLETRAEQLERERTTARLAAVNAERRRIARELHDVVAHHVSVMVVQAAAARKVGASSPERADLAMATVEQTGREALVEMRRLLEVLRTDEEPAGLEPQPDLQSLEELAGSFRDAGLAVDLRIDGPPRPLPAGLALSAYRIVQEALTNALKHAGRARVQVQVRYLADALQVTVHDDGRGAAADRAEPPVGEVGHGLVGMRERVAMHGGRLTAGPRSGGGFAVDARLPFDGARVAHMRADR